MDLQQVFVLYHIAELQFTAATIYVCDSGTELGRCKLTICVMVLLVGRNLIQNDIKVFNEKIANDVYMVWERFSKYGSKFI